MWENGPELDSASAATFAQGMKVVACADGALHDRELALINAFEGGLPEGTEPGPLEGEEVCRAYLQSLIMVALADGMVSDVEYVEIVKLAAEVGLDQATVDGEVVEVKREFLRTFAGVRIFRDAVVAIAKELGLDEAEVDKLKG